MQSPISRLGGKRLLAKTIVNQFPKHNTYVEPFCGAAWVFYTKEPSKVEILNDINGDLISFYRCIINHKEEFIRCFSDVLKHRDIFDEFRFKDRKHMTDIQKAVALVYTTKHSFSSKGENYCPPKGKSRFSLDVFKSRILDAYERLRDTYIENQHYSYIINRYDTVDTLFYCDPPYYNCENDYGKDLFYKHDHVKLFELLSNIKGKFCLSINDVPEIRDLYKDYKITEVPTRYSVNNITGGKPIVELLITNY